MRGRGGIEAKVVEGGWRLAAAARARDERLVAADDGARQLERRAAPALHAQHPAPGRGSLQA